MLHIIFFISIALAARTCCPECTCNTHTIYWDDPPRDIFLTDTYLPHLGIDPCLPYTSRSDYIQILTDHNITCSGEWCSNQGSFSCAGMGIDCWQVEHIFDLANSPYSDLNLNIYGNIIMAFGRWNNALGTRSWDIVEQEKRRVYENIFDQAQRNIVSCNGGDNNLGNVVLVVSVGSCLIFIFIFLVVKKMHRSFIHSESLTEIMLVE